MEKLFMMSSKALSILATIDGALSRFSASPDSRNRVYFGGMVVGRL